MRATVVRIRVVVRALRRRSPERCRNHATQPPLATAQVGTSLYCQQCAAFLLREIAS